MKAIAGATLAIVLAIVGLYEYLGPGGFALLIAGLAAAVLGLWTAKWAFVPRRELPRNRIRHQRIRLYLRLHPGRGHATWWELHRQWSRAAAYKRVRQVRSS